MAARDLRIVIEKEEMRKAAKPTREGLCQCQFTFFWVLCLCAGRL